MTYGILTADSFVPVGDMTILAAGSFFTVGNLAVLAVLALIVGLAVRSVVNAKKSGKCSCGSDCGSCGAACHECASASNKK